MSAIKLTNWYEIDEQEYLMYILKGYEISVDNVYNIVCWYLNEELHREDGPAVISVNGYKAWCRNGKIHREDGPAIKFSTGTEEWWLDGIEYTEAEYNVKMKEICQK